MKATATSRPLRLCLWAGLFALLVLAPGCEEPASVEKELGAIRVSFVPPSRWRHIDHGRQQRFEREGASMVMSALPPRVPPGLGGPSLGQWLEDTVRSLDGSTHRAIAARDTLHRDDQQVFVIDTWDRLTHEHRRRFAMLSRGNQQVSVHLERGDLEVVEEDFDELVASLWLLSPEREGGEPDAPSSQGTTGVSGSGAD